MELFTLREICEALNVTRRSIQCYEKAGLIGHIDKNKYGHLLYDYNSFERVKKIKFFQKIGFSLKEIGEIFNAKKQEVKIILLKRIEELKLAKEEMNDVIEETYMLIKELEND